MLDNNKATRKKTKLPPQKIIAAKNTQSIDQYVFFLLDSMLKNKFNPSFKTHTLHQPRQLYDRQKMPHHY